VISPGHHAIFRAGGRDFILYHRQSLPFAAGGPLLRQVSVDRLSVAGTRLTTVTPTNRGPDIAGAAAHRGPFRHVIVTASASADPAHAAASAADDNYATSWRSGPRAAWLEADLGKIGQIGPSVIRPGYPTATLRFSVQASVDGIRWWDAASETATSGSPIAVPAVRGARYLRLRFPNGAEIFEWSFAK
jgi:hypothetical protein